MKKMYVVLITGICLTVLSVIMIVLLLSGAPKYREIHIHADFKVYLNGEAYNFSQPRYMSSENRTLSPFMHLHNMDGNVIHQHISGFTLDYFFDSLGMEFNSTCFTLESVSYCNSGEKTLKFYVNDQPNKAFENYEFSDLDRILITYGSDSKSVIKTQIDSVTDKACIQSGKCPERGAPSNESTCTTAGGCAA